MKEPKDYQENEIIAKDMIEERKKGFVLPEKEKIEESNTTGKFFDFDIPGLGLLQLKIRFVTPSEIQKYRKSYIIQKKNKKTGRIDDYEDDDLRFEASKKMIYDAVTGWENIYDKDGKQVVFTRENLVNLIDIIGLQEINEFDDDGERKTVMSAITEAMKDSGAHFGQKKN